MFKGYRKVIMLVVCIAAGIVLKIFNLLDGVIAGIIISGMGFFAAANTWEHYEDTKKKELEINDKNKIIKNYDNTGGIG
ncbi:MAG: hypothetical protein GY714_20960 [Desulfobacterales bacterium]|nr:hypothetical protein [Desulfobacterales bacterium]